MVTPLNRPGSRPISAALEHARAGLRQVPDDGWEQQAAGLDWTCRETMAHILDDLGFYAMQLSGTHGHEGYTPLMEFPLAPGRPSCTFWPAGEGGTRAVLDCLDAVGGLLVAVVASAPVDRTGWHPYGSPDRCAVAAMGIVELVLHTRDILGAHQSTTRHRRRSWHHAWTASSPTPHAPTTPGTTYW